MKKLLIISVILFSSCSTDSGNYGSQSSTSSDSKACKNARSIYQACVYACMGNQVGSVVSAFASCSSSNKCDYAKSNIYSVCN